MHNLNIFFICDCSGSMAGSKIAALNTAVSRTISELKNVADELPGVHIDVHAIRFSNEAKWHSSSPLTDCDWTPIVNTGGLTALGQAYDLLTTHLTKNTDPLNKLPAVIVLLSDGKPTDDADAALSRLLSTKQGQRSNRYATGIGNEADERTLLNLTEQDKTAIAIKTEAAKIQQTVSLFTITGVKNSTFSMDETKR